MDKNKSAVDELIDYIINMTEEQVEKFMNHPVYKAIMEEQSEGASA